MGEKAYLYYPPGLSDKAMRYYAVSEDDLDWRLSSLKELYEDYYQTTVPQAEVDVAINDHFNDDFDDKIVTVTLQNGQVSQIDPYNGLFMAIYNKAVVGKTP